ncbi:Hypothetical predicted protein [Pelobates cultripes]|uniref:Uncharacterized protein n=1 Tax=Pelobates cultripes TaxID=61616 RepID=A0AAD1SEW7_PELCU|nr:Hypothetical predicted protein [Pelobates cultripes]
MDDARRRANVKVRGIAETVNDRELPHFIRRLLSEIMQPKQVKTLQVDGIHRLSKSPRAPADAPHDVLLRFQTTQDKQAVMDAVKNKCPLPFEDSQLTFLQDLCRATFEWRRSVNQVTKTLREASVQYRWGPSRTLVATQGETTRRLTSATDADPFLRSLGLTGLKKKAPTLGHSWDVPNIPPLYLAARPTQAETQQED